MVLNVGDRVRITYWNGHDWVDGDTVFTVKSVNGNLVVLNTGFTTHQNYLRKVE